MAAASNPTPRRDAREAGFTLIELMTVIAIVAILGAIALPQYRQAIIQAKESALKEDLARFRDVIDQYQADKGKYPESLQKLVDDGYLRVIPRDPITQGTDWVTESEKIDAENPGVDNPGISDVHSASDEVSTIGTRYSEW